MLIKYFSGEHPKITTNDKSLSMKQKPYLSYILSLFMLITVTAVKAEPNMSTLERISSHKIINIGYRDAPPYSYKTRDGQVVGYVIELCKNVTESLKKNLHINHLEVNYIPVPISMRISMLKHNVIDMDCSVNTDTVKRRSVVSFSRHYLLVQTRFGTPVGTNIHTFLDLAGRTISVTKGTADLISANTLNRVQNLNLFVLTQPTMKDAFITMTQHKSFATATNEVSLKELIESSEHPEDYQMSDLTLGTPQNLGIMLRYDDQEFKKIVDASLADRFKRHDFKSFYDQWFNSVLPDKNFNLHLPLTAGMYKYIAQNT